ncbi:hypothetical protein LshimejAT787_0902170 [Lyophyllum shimeji]|uniref:Uncharacterized protein n=1 Tax=Lyophyllum shimeji TaxID=47721 RepID=A0A9P3PQU5_LYOSH|nr:hypothetical protein LshimejAT787_0902170 [Lyophyllum shimeji]
MSRRQAPESELDRAGNMRYAGAERRLDPKTKHCLHSAQPSVLPSPIAGYNKKMPDGIQVNVCFFSLSTAYSHDQACHW